MCTVYDLDFFHGVQHSSTPQLVSVLINKVLLAESKGSGSNTISFNRLWVGAYMEDYTQQTSPEIVKALLNNLYHFEIVTLAFV